MDIASYLKTNLSFKFLQKLYCQELPTQVVFIEIFKNQNKSFLLKTDCESLQNWKNYSAVEKFQILDFDSFLV